jgi:hypothetical protein
MAEKDSKKKDGNSKRKIKKGSGGGWSVIAIQNKIPKHSQHGYVDFIATETMSEENILSRLKSIHDSRTGRGGVQDLADDINDAEKQAKGDEKYGDFFVVKTVGSDMSRDEAFDYKGTLADKTAKVYNQAIIKKGIRKS